MIRAILVVGLLTLGVQLGAAALRLGEQLQDARTAALSRNV